MSEICTRTQAKNIVEYVWRKRNHNDDIPLQYLTDMLVDCIAQALALAREEARAEAVVKLGKWEEARTFSPTAKLHEFTKDGLAHERTVIKRGKTSIDKGKRRK